MTPGDLLTYADGIDQPLVDAFSAAVCTAEGEQLRDLGTFASADDLAEAVRLALESD